MRGLAARLDDRFRLLTRGRRTALPRHQTLSATLDWSYNLLDETERVILNRLAVFAGNFSLEAAQAVAAGDDFERTRFVETVSNLVVKSLATADHGGRAIRYRLLDTTRAYVRQKLIESGEADKIARRHAIYYCELLSRTEVFFQSSALAKSGDVVTPEEHLANVHAALEWSFSARGDTQVGTALSAAAAPSFLKASLLAECRVWMQRSLAALDPALHGTRREMELQASLAPCLMFTKGNSEEVRSAFLRGLKLAEELEDHQIRLLGGLHIFLTRIGDFSGALDVAHRSRVVAELSADPAAVTMSDCMLGLSYHLVGDQLSAQARCESALRPSLSRYANLIRFGYDHRIVALAALARTLWLRGHADRAVTMARESLAEADTLDDPASLGACLMYAAYVFLWIGDWAVADAIGERLIEHAERYSLAPYHAAGLGFRGVQSLKRGDTQGGIALLRTCLQAIKADRYHVLTPGFSCELAEGFAMTGQVEAALATIDEVMRSGPVQSFRTPELWRLKGQLLALAGKSRPSEAESWLLRSLDEARRQSALSWELRTATSLAGLWRSQGRNDEAQRALFSVYERFTEGFGTADLRAAKLLLHEVA